jgi:hypothetical protein
MLRSNFYQGVAAAAAHDQQNGGPPPLERGATGGNENTPKDRRK